MRALGRVTLLIMLALPMRFAHAEGEQLEKLRRKTPSGRYVDPASFFRFHGYTSLSYSEAGADLGPQPAGTPHILVNPGPSPRIGANEGAVFAATRRFLSAVSRCKGSVV